ncbi:MAG: sugar O-acetyltransferase [Brevinema sp.]
MKTEFQKMCDGEMYVSSDLALLEMRKKARLAMHQYNQTSLDELDTRTQILQGIFGSVGKDVYIEPSITFDYGCNIFLGDDVYMNFGCTILDSAAVRIGSGTMIAPNVQIYTATHPIDVKTRNSGMEFAQAITIGENCWIGGGSIILPNVTIGNNTVIGAGSVVTKNIPDNVVAAGNPCRVIKNIQQ